MTDRLADVDHTDPHTDESFGATQVYDRGKTVVADGGEADADPEVDETEGAVDDPDTMDDVAHEPPHDDVGAQGAYERGEPTAPTDE